MLERVNKPEPQHWYSHQLFRRTIQVQDIFITVFKLNWNLIWLKRVKNMEGLMNDFNYDWGARSHLYYINNWDPLRSRISVIKRNLEKEKISLEEFIEKSLRKEKENLKKEMSEEANWELLHHQPCIITKMHYDTRSWSLRSA